MKRITIVLAVLVCSWFIGACTVESITTESIETGLSIVEEIYSEENIEILIGYFEEIEDELDSIINHLKETQRPGPIRNIRKSRFNNTDAHEAMSIVDESGLIDRITLSYRDGERFIVTFHLCDDVTLFISDSSARVRSDFSWPVSFVYDDGLNNPHYWQIHIRDNWFLIMIPVHEHVSP